MILSLDLGSARVGVVLAPATLPLEPAVATTILVAADLGATVREIERIGSSATRVICEMGRLFVPTGASPGVVAAIGNARETCVRLHERILMAFASRGIAVETVTRQAWSHRLVPHHKGGVPEQVANAEIASRVESSMIDMLTDQDQRDAAGALISTLLPKAHRQKHQVDYKRKLGTKRMRKGHPSDDAFNQLMMSKGLIA